MKLAEQTYNRRDIVASPPAEWSLAWQQEYFDWAKEVGDEVRRPKRGWCAGSVIIWPAAAGVERSDVDAV